MPVLLAGVRAPGRTPSIILHAPVQAGSPSLPHSDRLALHWMRPGPERAVLCGLRGTYSCPFRVAARQSTGSETGQQLSRSSWPLARRSLEIRSLERNSLPLPLPATLAHVEPSQRSEGTQRTSAASQHDSRVPAQGRIMRENTVHKCARRLSLFLLVTAYVR